ncbi:MAG TPA: hypothetical protein VFZ59_11960 [Verrucomicrobiae bacterium]|nr:hypothetical protein [Verrucomicrobiae bacterium]
MKVLLQNRATNCFLGERGNWVPMSINAKAFSTGVEAIHYSVAHHLRNVQLLLRFGAERYDIALALGD